MWTANEQDLVHNWNNCITSLTVLTRIALTISRQSLHGTPHYARQTRCVLLNSFPTETSRFCSCFSFPLFLSLSSYENPHESTQSTCRTRQSGVKKDVRIAFPRFNPQRAVGSFLCGRTDQQKRRFTHLRWQAREREREKSGCISWRYCIAPQDKRVENNIPPPLSLDEFCGKFVNVAFHSSVE